MHRHSTNRLGRGLAMAILMPLLMSCTPSHAFVERQTCRCPPKLDEKAMLEDLRKRYAGRIDAHTRGEEAREASRAMRELMAEWNPLLHRYYDLIQIIGTPTRETETHAVYIFYDSGRGSTIWEFKIHSGPRSPHGPIIGIEVRGTG